MAEDSDNKIFPRLFFELGLRNLVRSIARKLSCRSISPCTHTRSPPSRRPPAIFSGKGQVSFFLFSLPRCELRRARAISYSAPRAHTRSHQPKRRFRNCWLCCVLPCQPCQPCRPPQPRPLLLSFIFLHRDKLMHSESAITAYDLGRAVVG